MTDWLERYRGYLFMMLVNLIALGGVLFLLRRPTPGAIEIIPPPSPTPAPTATPAMVLVYISGAVANPDVYALPQGSRVKQAIEAAGGFTAQADRDRVNLAKRLHDEEQVYVPQMGEETWPLVSPVTSGSSSDQPSSPSGGVININTATAAELESLPGIGPTYAQRIIEYREQNGPFQRIEEVMRVRGIGQVTFEKIKDQITVQ
ncbi:MAG: helix-hairpin-helix domain-containing protein [Anaerolineae bacterium]